MKSVTIIIILVVIIIVIIAITRRKTPPKDDSSQVLSKSVSFTNLGNKGQTGNQLFQIAAVMGIAHDNQADAVFPVEIRNTSAYKLMNLENLTIQGIENKKTVTETYEGYYDKITLEPSLETTDLNGWFQSYLYFENIREQLLQLFTPREEHLQAVQLKTPQALHKNSIGVHVRRGDYLKDHYSDIYTLCSVDYYQRGVELILSKLSESDRMTATVIVCSDDIAWCRKNLNMLPNVVFSKATSAEEDFCILYQCQHQVMSNSSFSWWSAYLKPPHTIHSIVAPYPWYKKTGPLSELNSDEIYYHGWNILDVDRLHDYIPSRTMTFVDLAESRFKIDNNISLKTFEAKQHLYGKVMVVSMETMSERFESAKHILAKAGLNAIRFPAVDKSVIAALNDRQGLKDLDLISMDDAGLDGLGTIGCGLSHMAAWAYAVKNGIHRLTMFEDDIISYINEKELDERVANAMQVMDPDWDFLFLGKCIDRCDLYEKVSDGLFRTFTPYCTHAYMISDSGMKKMLNRPLYTGVDTQIVNSVKSGIAKAYTLHPSVFMQDILKWSSSLRNFKMQIGNQIDCAYIPDE